MHDKMGTAAKTFLYSNAQFFIISNHVVFLSHHHMVANRAPIWRPSLWPTRARRRPTLNTTRRTYPQRTTMQPSTATPYCILRCGKRGLQGRLRSDQSIAHDLDGEVGHEGGMRQVTWAVLYWESHYPHSLPYSNKELELWSGHTPTSEHYTAPYWVTPDYLYFVHHSLIFYMRFLCIVTLGWNIVGWARRRDKQMGGARVEGVQAYW